MVVIQNVENFIRFPRYKSFLISVYKVCRVVDGAAVYGLNQQFAGQYGSEDVHACGQFAVFACQQVYEYVAYHAEHYAVRYAVSHRYEQHADEGRYRFGIVCKVDFHH